MALLFSFVLRSGFCKVALHNFHIAEGLTVVSRRGITLSSQRLFKEIKVTKEGNTTFVEGVLKESPRKDFVVKVDSLPDVCPLCRLDLPLRHTDVLILSQFVRSDGTVLPSDVTGLCSRQQKTLEKLVTEAQKAGLMANLSPSNMNEDPSKRSKWEKWNTYFLTDEEKRWKEIDEKESHYYEKPSKKRILTLKDVL